MNRRFSRPVMAVLALAGSLLLAPTAAFADNSVDDLHGIVRVVAADPLSHSRSDGDHYDLVLNSGKRDYTLTGDAAEQARPNRRVAVSGELDGTELEVSGVRDLGPAVGRLSTVGTTRMLVMLATWSSPDSVTPQIAGSQLFGDTNAWFRDASYGKLGQTGDVTPWMQIAGPAGGRCYSDRTNIMEQARTAAAALGYHLDAYDNFLVYFPNNSWQSGSDCNALAGWAYVGSSDTWINGYMDRRVTTHEQGHNYGLWHAHSYLCGGVITGACSWSDYGDDFDAMGGSNVAGHFNGAEKAKLGWMQDRVSDLSGGGTSTLRPLAELSASTQAIRVAASDTRTYWLELRRPIGFDSVQPAYGQDGVQVRVVDRSLNLASTAPYYVDDGTDLLDVRPADGQAVTSATLKPGTEWTSPENLTFRVDSMTGDSAQVTVTQGRDTAAPSVDFTYPQRAATRVMESTAVTIGFSEDVTGVTPKTFTLMGPSGAAIPGQVYVQDDRSTVHLVPEAGLASDTRYTVRLTGNAKAIRDTAGNPLRTTSFSFLTGPGPAVEQRIPDDKGRGASRTAGVKVAFSEPVAGVSASTFQIVEGGTTEPLPASVTQLSPQEYLLTPATTLKAKKGYAVSLVSGTGAIRDLAGNPLASTGSRWTFITGS